MKYEMIIKRDNNTKVMLYTYPMLFNEDNTDCEFYLKVKRVDDMRYIHVHISDNAYNLPYDEMKKVEHKLFLQWVTEEEIAKAKQKFIKMYNKELCKK